MLECNYEISENTCFLVKCVSSNITKNFMFVLHEFSKKKLSCFCTPFAFSYAAASLQKRLDPHCYGKSIAREHSDTSPSDVSRGFLRILLLELDYWKVGWGRQGKIRYEKIIIVDCKLTFKIQIYFRIFLTERPFGRSFLR